MTQSLLLRVQTPTRFLLATSKHLLTNKQAKSKKIDLQSLRKSLAARNRLKDRTTLTKKIKTTWLKAHKVNFQITSLNSQLSSTVHSWKVKVREIASKVQITTRRF